MVMSASHGKIQTKATHPAEGKKFQIRKFSFENFFWLFFFFFIFFLFTSFFLCKRIKKFTGGAEGKGKKKKKENQRRVSFKLVLFKIVHLHR